MGEGSERLLRATQFAPVLATLTVMVIVAIIYAGPCLCLIGTVPILGFLFIIPRLGWDDWLLVYLSLALSILYASVAFPTIVFLPVYSVLLLRFIGNIPTSISFSGDIIGPSSGAILKVLPFFLVAALANYKVVFSVAVLAASVLVFVLIKYVGLGRFTVTSVTYDREIRIGERLIVNIHGEFPSDGYVLISLGGVTKIFHTSNSSSFMLNWRAFSIGRYSLVLHVTIFDSWFAARRTIAEVPVTFFVLPTYTGLVRRLRRELASLPSSLAEPVKVAVFVLGGLGKRIGDIGGFGEIEHYLRRLPSSLRSVARSLLFSPAWSGNDVGAGIGHSRGIFGEYYGVREFVAGDTLRSVHWKKSVSYGRLIVKEFVSGEAVSVGSVGVGQYAPIIVADLTSSSSDELDHLVTTLLSFLSSMLKRSRNVKMVLIMVFGDVVITLEGTVEEVSVRVVEAFTKVIPSIVYEYSSIGISADETVVKNIISSRGCCTIINAIMATSFSYARDIAEILMKHGLIPPKTITIIHGAPTVLRNAFLAYRLRTAGYKVLDLAGTSLNNRAQTKNEGMR